jgi:hypothetical protein
MDFHAVFEAFENGCWCVHDATGLAPRPSLVRIVTGRDAADTAFAAFAAVTSGIVNHESNRGLGNCRRLVFASRRSLGFVELP